MIAEPDVNDVAAGILQPLPEAFQTDQRQLRAGQVHEDFPFVDFSVQKFFNAEHFGCQNGGKAPVNGNWILHREDVGSRKLLLVATYHLSDARIKPYVPHSIYTP